MTTLHVVLNEFAPDYRVLKETSALAEAGWDVEVFALAGSNLPLREVTDGVSIKRFALRSRTLPKYSVLLPLKLAECVTRMVAAGARKRPNIVHAHDLSGLVVGYLVAKLTGAVLIYDSHELWSDSNHRSQLPLFMGEGIVHLERMLAPAAAKCITVSSGIADLMAERLGVSRPVLIRNVPERARSTRGPSPLRSALSIPAEAVVFLHLGGILPNRGIETILASFAALDDSNVHLVFLGVDSLPSWLEVPVARDVRSRIHVHPRVPPREVVTYARGADAGIVATAGVNASHRYCLPNKFFETLQAGLPVIATDLPEMAGLIHEHGVGIVFSDRDAMSLADAMRKLIEDPHGRLRMRERSEQVASTLCWEKERAVLFELYESLKPAQSRV